MCDDEQIHSVSPEDVLKLAGGGDWHTAYVLLYGPRKVELVPHFDTEATPAADSAAGSGQS